MAKNNSKEKVLLIFIGLKIAELAGIVAVYFLGNLEAKYIFDVSYIDLPFGFNIFFSLTFALITALVLFGLFNLLKFWIVSNWEWAEELSEDD